MLGEEGGAIGSGRVAWHVDPIDGTVNFARGIAFWCVSVAAAIDGVVVAGAIADPMGGNEFTADLTGVWHNGRPARPRAAPDEIAATVVSTFPRAVDLGSNGAGAMDASRRLVEGFGAVRCLGSGALGLAHVAVGWADATFDMHTNPWDVAAGSLMVRQAGGATSATPAVSRTRTRSRTSPAPATTRWAGRSTTPRWRASCGSCRRRRLPADAARWRRAVHRSPPYGDVTARPATRHTPFARSGGSTPGVASSAGPLHTEAALPPQEGSEVFIQIIQGKCSNEERMHQLSDEWRETLGPTAEGWLGGTYGVTDDGEFLGIVRFESREAAARNSARPEQGAWWRKMQECFEGDVTFHDCDDVMLMLDGGSDEAGFVQVMQGRATDPEKFHRFNEQPMDALHEQRPDIIGGTIAMQPDGWFTETIFFRTRPRPARASASRCRKRCARCGRRRCPSCRTSPTRTSTTPGSPVAAERPYAGVGAARGAHPAHVCAPQAGAALTAGRARTARSSRRSRAGRPGRRAR